MAKLRRLLNLFRRSRIEREIEEEIESHLLLRLDDNLAREMAPDEARRNAAVRFGNRVGIRERVAGEDLALAWVALWCDLRFAMRQLRRFPGFTWASITVLALGIGASVALFAFVDATLIQPLPYAHPEQLVDVTENLPLFPRANLSYPDYLDWKERNHVFRSLDVYRGQGFLMTSGGGTVPVRGADVSANFFRTLGVEPALGSNFATDADQPQAPKTVLLTYRAWQRDFGGQRSVVGRPVVLDGEPVTVIGVLPRTFQFALRGDADFWRPLQQMVNGPNCYLHRDSHCLYGVGRLKDGVSVARALAEMKAIAANLEKEYPESNRGQGASVLPLAQVIVGSVRPLLLTLLGGAALLLCIACVNVSSLLLVRTETRQHELALRSALGADRSRLRRQFATEAALLVTAGSLVGLVLAELLMHGLLGLLSQDMVQNMPYLQGLRFNLHVLLFTALVSVVSFVVFSGVPMTRLTRAQDLRADLAEGGRGASGMVWKRFGSKLVVLELATAMVLLVGAGLLVKSGYRLLHVQLGFHPDHLATLDVSLPERQYATEHEQATAGQEVLRRISALPGVRSVGSTIDLPVSGNGDTRWVRFLDRPYNGEHMEVLDRQVSAGYFATIGAALLRGRTFTEHDDSAHPRVAIINGAFAEKYFPGEDPIGKQFGGYKLEPESINAVIGVVEDVREGGLNEQVWPAYYVPYSQNPDTFLHVVARTSADPAALLPTMVMAIHHFDPGVASFNPDTMEGRIAASPAAYLHRSAAWLVGGFAVIALVLSSIGLYGVIAYSVSRRTREIGVRMALGAARSTIVQLILREAGTMIAMGVVAGLLVSVGTAMLMRGLLFGTTAWDLPTLAAMALVLSAAALAATYLPARSAAAISPIEALRTE